MPGNRSQILLVIAAALVLGACHGGPSIQAGGGCSSAGASAEPSVGAVESALGIFAIALLVLRLRRRRVDLQPAAPSLNPKARKQRFADTRGRTSLRIPYVDLGRESFASIPDDR